MKYIYSYVSESQDSPVRIEARMFSKLMFVVSNMRLNLMLTDNYYQTLKNRPAGLRNNQIAAF